MSAHSVLLAVAAVAPAARVRIAAARGELLELPLAPVEAAAPTPDPIEALGNRLLERDGAMRLLILEAGQATRDAFAEVVDLLTKDPGNGQRPG